MRRTLASLLTVLVLAALASCPGLCKPSRYGFPDKLRYLTDLDHVRLRKLSPVQCTEVLVSWLVEEHRHPSPTGMGLGGEITSGYIQMQIVHALREFGDPLVVEQVALDKQIDRDIRIGMRICLGMMGDRRQIPVLMDVARTHPETDYRGYAVSALGYTGATEAIPVLERALKDTGTAKVSRYSKGPDTVYPVRERAADTLRLILRTPEGLKQAQQRTRDFDARLRAARRHPSAHKLPRSVVAHLREPADKR